VKIFDIGPTVSPFQVNYYIRLAIFSGFWQKFRK